MHVSVIFRNVLN